MRRGLLEEISTLALTVAALSVAGVALWQKLASRPSAPQLETTSNWRTYAFPGNEIGPVTARVTVVEFSDFQCPFCAKASRALDLLREEHPKDIRLVFRHFPVATTHEHAFDAAIASECAALQGRFKEYHDVLFADQGQIGKVSWNLLAMRANIPDTASFGVCMDRKQTKLRVEHDMDAARDLGIRGTPLLLVNGQHLMTGDSAQIRRVIEAALK